MTCVTENMILFKTSLRFFANSFDSLYSKTPRNWQMFILHENILQIGRIV